MGFFLQRGRLRQISCCLRLSTKLSTTVTCSDTLFHRHGSVAGSLPTLPYLTKTGVLTIVCVFGHVSSRRELNLGSHTVREAASCERVLRLLHLITLSKVARMYRPCVQSAVCVKPIKFMQLSKAIAICIL